MLSWLFSFIALIRVIPSDSVPGILDLQRRTDAGWETYNNIALLVETDNQWNSAELNGGAITQTGPGTFLYAPLDNGARVQVEIRVTGQREIAATARVLAGNVTKIALSNDFGLATGVRFVAGSTVYDALEYPPPNDANYVPGTFVPIAPERLLLIGGGLIQYQNTVDPIEAFIEVRRTPWLPSQAARGQWIERVHLTRASGGAWTFGYYVYRAVVGGLAAD